VSNFEERDESMRVGDDLPLGDGASDANLEKGLTVSERGVLTGVMARDWQD